MNEHPWHLPSSTTKHYQWFRNLADFHDLTLAWISELQTDRAPHALARGPDRELTEDLWMLDSLSETKIDQLLDDTSPDDLLARLEHTVWATQAMTLIQILERASEAEKKPLIGLLEQTSWKAGKRLAESRWQHLPEVARQDLRSLLLTLADSPFSGRRSELLLIRRALETEVQFELQICPHQVPHPEVRPVADLLCRLHVQWIRGFVYALNHRVFIEDAISSPRCIQKWSFSAKGDASSA